MWMTVPSHAQNRGVYPLGMSAINSGVMPESAFTYSNQFLLYTRDEAKDNEGRTLPVTGNHSVILDMNTITWVSTERILGARYAASATPPFLEERSDFRPSGQPQRRQWICGLVLPARHLGLELGQGRGSRDVWVPGSHRPIQRGRERQCRFGLLDAYPVYRADLLPDREQTSFRSPHFRCTSSTPYRKAPAFIRARPSTWTIRSCIRWHAPGASSCRRPRRL